MAGHPFGELIVDELLDCSCSRSLMSVYWTEGWDSSCHQEVRACTGKGQIGIARLTL